MLWIKGMSFPGNTCPEVLMLPNHSLRNNGDAVTWRSERKLERLCSLSWSKTERGHTGKKNQT
jgi:hypothetical protein